MHKLRVILDVSDIPTTTQKAGLGLSSDKQMLPEQCEANKKTTTTTTNKSKQTTNKQNTYIHTNGLTAHLLHTRYRDQKTKSLLLLSFPWVLSNAMVAHNSIFSHVLYIAKWLPFLFRLVDSLRAHIILLQKHYRSMHERQTILCSNCCCFFCCPCC